MMTRKHVQIPRNIVSEIVQCGVKYPN